MKKNPGTSPLPTGCPSCAGSLTVCELNCASCETSIRGHYPLPSYLLLTHQDQQFMNQFVLASGSLKALAKSLGVSYPTVRNRLDDVIERLHSSLQTADQP